MKKLNYGLLSKYRLAIYGFSIIWIMLGHGEYVNYTWKGCFSIFRLGYMGVDIFLLLSGISLYFSFVKDKDIINFYKRRIIRIYVPFIMINIIYFIYLLLYVKLDSFIVLAKILNVEYWINGGLYVAYWYVAFILICYLAYPIIHLYLFQSDDSFIRLVILLTYILVINYLVYKINPAMFIKLEKALTRIPVFIVGCYLGRSVYRKEDISTKQLVVSFGCLILFLIVMGLQLLDGLTARYMLVIGSICISLWLAIILEILKLGIIDKLLGFFGKMSYELYIVHMLLKYFYKNVCWFYQNGDIYRYIGVLVLCVFVAWLFYQLDDMLIRKMKKAIE